jgi:hypothetical protein
VGIKRDTSSSSLVGVGETSLEAELLGESASTGETKTEWVTSLLLANNCATNH